MEEQASEQPLRVVSVKVRSDRIELIVRVSHRRYCVSDDALIRQCLNRYPTLGVHTCRNEVGPTFACVMRSTSTPHVLEHLIIDIETRAARNADRVFTGTTQWDGCQGAPHQADMPIHNAFQAHVAVSFEDDMVALAAIKEAVSFLNQALLDVRG